MSAAHRVPRRPARGLLAGLAAGVLLAGCGGDGGSEERPAAAPTSAEDPAGEPGDRDLAAGLLPAATFGPDATVVAVSPDELRTGAGLAAAAEGLEITPDTCRATVDGTQPDIDDFADVAAQSATTGSSTTVQVLLRSGPVEDTVARLAGAAQRCPSAQITSPEIGQATVDFEDVPVAELGDGAAVLRYTTSLAAPDGSRVSVPTLIGAVQDGDRLLLLLGIDTGQDPTTAMDPAAFTDLLEQAYQAQAAALG